MFFDLVIYMVCLIAKCSLQPFSRGEQKKTWLDSQEFCRAIGGDLASINGKEEQYVIWHSIA